VARPEGATAQSRLAHVAVATSAAVSCRGEGGGCDLELVTREVMSLSATSRLTSRPTPSP